MFWNGTVSNLIYKIYRYKFQYQFTNNLPDQHFLASENKIARLEVKKANTNPTYITSGLFAVVVKTYSRKYTSK